MTNSAKDKGKGPIIADTRGPMGNFFKNTESTGQFQKSFEGPADYSMEQQMIYQNIAVQDPQAFQAMLSSPPGQIGENSQMMGTSNLNPVNLTIMESPFDSGYEIEAGFNVTSQELQEINGMMMEQESPTRKRMRDPEHTNKDGQLTAGYQRQSI